MFNNVLDCMKWSDFLWLVLRKFDGNQSNNFNHQYTVELNFKPISARWIKFDEFSVYSKLSSILILNSYLEVCKDVWCGWQRLDWHLGDDKDHQVHLQHDGTSDGVRGEAGQGHLQEDGQVWQILRSPSPPKKHKCLYIFMGFARSQMDWMC